MLGGGYSLQTQASSSGGDTSRAGQASGLVGNLVNLVSGKGNTATQTPSTSAQGSPSADLWLIVGGTAAAVGLLVWLILRKR
jgi:hypothetical protein